MGINVLYLPKLKFELSRDPNAVVIKIWLEICFSQELKKTTEDKDIHKAAMNGKVIQYTGCSMWNINVDTPFLKKWKRHRSENIADQ